VVSLYDLVLIAKTIYVIFARIGACKEARVRVREERRNLLKMVLKVLSKEIEKICVEWKWHKTKALSRGSLNLDPDPLFSIYAGFDATATHG